MSKSKGVALTAIRVLLALTLYIVGAVVLGLALVPSALLVRGAWETGLGQAVWWKTLWVCWAAALGYFVFGFSLMFLTALAQYLFRLDLKEGVYPLGSLGMLKWYVSNALQLLVWTTFGDFILLTPFSSLYYRLMGAKLGLNVQINSKYCADLSLLEIGDGAVIGGHATVIGHSFEQDKLILKKVRIGPGVVVGLNSVVLPGAEIGDNAVVGAGAFVPKDTKIPPGTTYLGPGRSGQAT